MVVPSPATGAAPAAGAVHLSGTIVADDAGRPWEVRLSPVASSCEDRPAEPNAGNRPAAQATRTETRGFFRFEVPRPGPLGLDVLRGGVAVHRWVLEPSFVSWDLGELALGAEEGDLDDDGGADVRSVSGKVVDSEGTGLRDAYVWVTGRPECYTRTAEGGRFELGVAAGQELSAARDGYFPSRIRVPEETSQGLLFELREARWTIAGRVTDFEGRPIPRARVEPAVGRPVVTDSRGGFVLAGMPSDEALVALEVHHAGYAPARTRAPTSPIEAETRVEIVLSRPRMVLGRTVDEEGGGVEGVVAWLETGTSRLETRSGAEGRFRIGPLTPAAYTLVLEREGFGGRDFRFELPPGGGPHRLGRVELRPEIVLRGRVVDEDGNGVGGADVVVRREEGSLSAALREGCLRLSGTTPHTASVSMTTEGDGSFLVENLGSGHSLAVDVSKPGFLPATHRFVVDGGADPVEIELSRGAAVSVNVRDERGRPVPRARIEWSDPEGELPEDDAETDEDGSATFTTGAPARIDLRVTKWGYAQWTGAVEVPPSSEGLEVGATLWPGSTLKGLVHDPQRRPISGAVVQPPGHPLEALTAGVTGLNGEYELYTLPRRQMTFRVSHPEYETTSVRKLIASEEETLDIELVPRDQVAAAGFVTQEGLVPVPGAHVRLTSLDTTGNRAQYYATTDVGGFFDLGGVVRGRYRATVVADGLVLEAGQAEVVIDGPETLSLSLTPPCVLRGRATGLAPEELDGAAVTLAAAAGSRRLGLAEDGSFAVELAPATWSVVGLAEGGRASRRELVACQAGEPVEVALVF
jgi:protocatechuate 3,4-dioxygenase beta subunit